MIYAAGILFCADDGRVLLLRRSAEGDHAGEWGIPGGKIEEGESNVRAALREVVEEIGVDARKIEGAGKLIPHCRRVADGVDWTTFIVRVPAPFEVTLNEEHDESMWATVQDPPAPMHPGAQLVLDRIGMDELDVAQAIAAGTMVSPQRYENLQLVAMRITGTGVSYRSGSKEFVWRDPELYLNDRFLARCNGLPVIVEHPEGDTLNSDEFAERIAGTILLPYVKQNEVWGIAKIYDATTIDAIETHRLSTSPAVVFREAAVNQTESLEDGTTLLIEGKPSLLDHLAICELGVWDKGGQPTGIASTINDGVAQVADPKDKAGDDKGEDKGADEKAAEKLAEKKADKKADSEGAAGGEGGGEGDGAGVAGKLDAILAGIESLSTRVAALEGDDAGGGEGEGGGAAMDDDSDLPPELRSMPAETAADRFRKDAACKGYRADMASKADAAKQEAEDKAAMADSAKRTDSQVRKLQEEIAALRGQMPKAEAEADRAALGLAQARADGFYGQHGLQAPRPMLGESVLAYRSRAANGMKAHSKSWGDIKLEDLHENTLAVAEAQIYADAAQAARNPVDLPNGELRAIVSTDRTGRHITTFTGRPGTGWMHEFSAHRKSVIGIGKGN